MLVINSILFVIFPIFSMPLSFINMISNKRHAKVYMVFFSIAIGILSMNLFPREDFDLYRYYLKIENYMQNSFLENITNIFSNFDSFAYLIIYIVGLIGNNTLLQFFSVTIGYILYMNLILNIIKDKKYNTFMSLFIIVLFICSFEFILLYSSFRNFVAMAIFANLIYKQYYRKEKISIIWYFIPVMFHISMLLPLLIKVVVDYGSKFLKNAMIILSFVFSITIKQILELLYRLSNISIFLLLYNKLKWYSDATILTMQDDYFIFKILIYLFLLFVTICINKKMKETKNDNKIFNYSQILSIVCLCFLFNRTLFIRYTLLLYIITFINYFSIRECFNKNIRFILSSIFFAIAITTIYAQYIYISVLTCIEPWSNFILRGFLNFIN